MLATQKQRYWSILPLSPTRLEDGNSPYQTGSAYAGNPLLISPEKLIEDGLLQKQDVKRQTKPEGNVNFELVYLQKEAALRKAYANFRESDIQASEFEDFCAQNDKWLGDYALYVALRQKTGKPWYQWLPSLRYREPKAIARKRQLLKSDIDFQKFTQYLFFRQWQSLKEHCRAKQIGIIGDIPFYVAYDSADVWVHRELFSLKKNGAARFVGGVPPDYFSATGQLWGNPVYNWQKHEETGFQWWIDRIKHNLTLCDKLRLDHFRGFVAYWRVHATQKTAMKGRWVKTPSKAFFNSLRQTFPSLPFIAEDLGYIDEPVRDAIKRLGMPGMRVILFGLDGSEDNPHVPSNHIWNSVVYTGTHDTNTAKGWFTSEATPKEKHYLSKIVGKRISGEGVSFEIVKLALASVSDLSIVPLQDVLGLGAEARMNNPSQAMRNWRWRVTTEQLQSEKISEFGELAVDCGRAG